MELLISVLLSFGLPLLEGEEEASSPASVLILPVGVPVYPRVLVSSGPFSCWLASVASFLVPGALCGDGGVGSSRRPPPSLNQLVSTRPHEADRCKGRLLPSARLPS